MTWQALNHAVGRQLIASQHLAQIISLNAFNLNDKLYRNHLSFIKEFAPEIGRGVRFNYTMNFY